MACVTCQIAHASTCGLSSQEARAFSPPGTPTRALHLQEVKTFGTPYPLPPGRFLKTGPPASRFAGWSRGFIYLYLPARVWHHPAFWFWDSRKNQKMDPRGIQNSKEKEKKKASPSMREKQRKRATSSTTPRRSPAAEYRRSRHLPSGTHEAGKAAAPSPHTRTHSVLRVHVLHYIRRLAPKRSAQAGNNIGGHRVPL